MTRWVHEHRLERRQQRVDANPALRKRRNQMVEHPVGTSKPWQDHGYVVMKGRAKVRAAFRLSPLADNLRRVMTILGGSHLLRALA